MKAIAYYRVSTEMQEEKESLATQIKGGEQFCEDNNIELVKIFTDVMSGGNRKRKGFLEAQKFLEDHKDINMFIAYDVSRIARDAFAFLGLFNKLNSMGIKLKLINNPNLDSDSHMGRLILTILAAIFEFFRFDNSDRVRDNMIVKVKEGKRMGGVFPYGYDYNKETKKATINVGQAAEIKEMFNMFISGNTIMSIAKKFNLPEPTIRNRLMNNTYAGFNSFGYRKNDKINNNKKAITTKGDWEAIVSEDIFNEAQKILKRNKEMRIKKIKDSGFSLTSFMRCSCGSKMRGSTNFNRDKTKKFRYYECRACQKYLNADKIEKNFFEQLLNCDDLQILNKKLEKRGSTEYKIKKLEKELSKLSKELDHMTSLVIKGIIDENRYMKSKSENLFKTSEIVKEIEELKKEETEEFNFNTIELFKEILKNLKPDDILETRNILFKIIRKITVIDEENFEVYLNI